MNVKIDLLDNIIAEFRNRNPEEPKYMLLPLPIYQQLQTQLQILTQSFNTDDQLFELAFYEGITIFRTMNTPNVVVYSSAEFHNIMQNYYITRVYRN